MAKKKATTKEIDLKKKPSDFINKKLLDISTDEREISFHFTDGTIKVTGDNFRICTE